MGAPPHWMSNVQVANVDATVAQAKKAGAKVHREASDIPKVGRFAVIADPQGASLSVFSPLQPMPPSWMYYVHVDDLDAAVARAKSKGGKVLNGPMDVPGGDRIAQLSDPQGAMFALHASKK